MRFLDYISRIGKSRGFGIQSPWAYSFVREVIFEKWPYYGYKEIDENFSSRKERNKQKLFLRIRNFIHGRELQIIDLNIITNIELASLFADKQVGAIVIENPYSNNKNAELWEAMKLNESVGITFDLYSLCICFPRDNKFKQHYKMNF